MRNIIPLNTVDSLFQENSQVRGSPDSTVWSYLHPDCCDSHRAEHPTRHYLLIWRNVLQFIFGKF